MNNKCDVLYIHPTKNPIGEDKLKFAFVPMGSIAILNQLRQKDISVLGINFAAEKTLQEDFTVTQALQEIDYQILMVDLHWYEHAFGAIYVEA